MIDPQPAISVQELCSNYYSMGEATRSMYVLPTRVGTTLNPDITILIDGSQFAVHYSLNTGHDARLHLRTRNVYSS